MIKHCFYFFIPNLKTIFKHRKIWLNFETVNLKTIKKQMVRQASLKNFEISCNKYAKQEVKSEAKK
jgi:hypothetical protein